MPDTNRARPLPAPLARKRVSPALPLIATLAAMVAPAPALAAGGAFAVDDAEVDKPGACKVESWASFGSNHDFLAVTSPACVANLGVPVELGVQFQRMRSDGDWSTSASPRFKVNILPVETGRIALGLEGMATWDLGNGVHDGDLLFVPLTYKFSETFRLNANVGWQYDAVSQLSYAYWGAGFEWKFKDPMTLIGEVYGFDGPSSVDTSVTNPRAQIGLRITPVDNADIDLIYGNNINGENAHWFTLGLNLRF